MRPSVHLLAQATDHTDAMRREFEKLVDAGRQGHTGDVTPRGNNFARAMARDYPSDNDDSVPDIEMK